MKFDTYEKLEQAYAKEEVYPLDLKQGVAAHLNNVCTVFFSIDLGYTYVPVTPSNLAILQGIHLCTLCDSS